MKKSNKTNPFKLPIFAIAAIILTLPSCSLNKVRGPKLYEKIFIKVETENTLIVPTSTDREFLSIIKSRLLSLSEIVIPEEGNLRPASECGPKTMKIVHDIASINLGGQSDYRAGFITDTKKTNQYIEIATLIRVEDCETGKILYRGDKTERGNTPYEVIRSLVESAVDTAYDFEFQIQKRQ